MKVLLLFLAFATLIIAEKNTDDSELNKKYKITKIKAGSKSIMI